MAFVFLIFAPLDVAAWVKVGPIAGAVMTAWLLVILVIASRPGTSLWTPGPWSPPSDRRSYKSPPDTQAEPGKNRRT